VKIGRESVSVRSLLCQHRKPKTLRCAGMEDEEICHWDKYRTGGDFIRRTVGNRGRPHTDVMLSASDRVVVARPQSGETHGIGDASALFDDPGNRFQRGGVGYLRIPLNAARTRRRNEAPEWLNRREEFISTLSEDRGARAERILSAFFLDHRTDVEIAGEVGWTRDAVKRERRTLVLMGKAFFERQAPQHPPSPAVSEGVEVAPASL
jgi:hypothetical protein